MIKGTGYQNEKTKLNQYQKIVLRN